MTRRWRKVLATPVGFLLLLATVLLALFAVVAALFYVIVTAP